MKTKTQPLNNYLEELKLPFLRENAQSLAKEAAQKNWTHLDYLQKLMEGEVIQRQERRVQRRIKAARFPLIKTLEDFQWNWPKKINRALIEHLAQLQFIREKSNVVLVGQVGLGKTHLAIALAYQACLEGYSVLFANTINIVNELSAAQKRGTFKAEIKKYLTPQLLVLDEMGYLPIDQHGADLLFQVISQRYEQGSIILTTNLAFKKWASIFGNDSTIASAVLDRLLHHAETIVVEGKSYRMKDRISSPMEE